MSSLVGFSCWFPAPADAIATPRCERSTTRDRAMMVARSLNADECRVLLAAALPSCFDSVGSALSREERIIVHRFSQLDTGLLEAVCGDGQLSFAPTPFGRLVVWAVLTESIASRMPMDQEMSRGASHALRGGETGV